MTYLSAADWTVKEGHEEAFVATWRASVDRDPPIEGLAGPPRLLRDLDRPGHFLSFAQWESREAIEAFRARPDSLEAIERIKEHADFSFYTLEDAG